MRGRNLVGLEWGVGKKGSSSILVQVDGTYIYSHSNDRASILYRAPDTPSVPATPTHVRQGKKEISY